MNNETSYLDTTAQHRIDAAVEMISELLDKNGRVSALCGALLGQLTPLEGKKPDDVVAFRLAELLDEQLGDIGQQLRLQKCLTAIQQRDIARQ